MTAKGEDRLDSGITDIDGMKEENAREGFDRDNVKS